jgi:hypothetical protein
MAELRHGPQDVVAAVPVHSVPHATEARVLMMHTIGVRDAAADGRSGRSGESATSANRSIVKLITSSQS